MPCKPSGKCSPAERAELAEAKAVKADKLAKAKKAAGPAVEEVPSTLYWTEQFYEDLDQTPAFRFSVGRQVDRKGRAYVPTGVVRLLTGPVKTSTEFLTTDKAELMAELTAYVTASACPADVKAALLHEAAGIPTAG